MTTETQLSLFGERPRVTPVFPREDLVQEGGYGAGTASPQDPGEDPPAKDAVQLTLFGDPDEFTLAAQEWRGMPEYSQEDLQSWRQLIVHFDGPADLAAFIRLVDQPITRRTRFIWYPKKDREEFVNTRYGDEEGGGHAA